MSTRLKFVADCVLQAVVLITLICVLVPLLPQMPAGGLDASWAVGMNQAVAQGLKHGRDMIFTFGPYASIYTGLYHPSTDVPMMVGASFLALCYWAAFRAAVGTGAWYLVLFLVFIFAGLLYTKDALLFSYPLLVGIYCHRIVSDAGKSVKTIGLIALLFAPFGLLPLIKGSLLVLCGAVAGLVFVLFALHRKLRLGMTVALSCTLSLLLFWTAAGQSIAGLPQWVVSLSSIVSGYTEAMSIDGIGWEIPCYLVGSMTVLVAVYQREGSSGSAYLALLFAGYLFLAFKAGFVRHDVHAVTAGAALAFAGAFILLRFPSRESELAMFISTLVCIAICSNYADVSPGQVASNIRATYSSAWTGLRLRISEGKRLQEEYDAALSTLQASGKIPVLQGTWDIYSYNQSHLIASGNTWNPRPVLQSYSAYTPTLAETNRSHLLGRLSPDHIVFRIETIDGRIPSGDDGASWPILLHCYTPSGMDKSFLYLHKTRCVVPDEMVIGQRSAIFEVPQAVPVSEIPVFAKLHVRPTLAGKLVSALFKPRPILIRLELQDGSVRVLRVIPGMADSGMLISPLIESTTEFGALYGEIGHLSGKKVKSFAIASDGGRWQWESQYEAKFVTYGPHPGDPTSVGR